MGQKIASLEIELGMATGGAVADLNRFGGVVDKVTAQAIRDLDRIDAATKGVGDMSAATAQMVKFAEATAKSTISAARDFNRVERAGESMAAQLERQISVYGKNASEIRAMKAESAALAAQQQGQAELAARIRAREQQLYDMEFATMRRARQEADALAQDRATAAAQAAQAAESEAQALRSAAFAHQMFEARVRDGAAAMRAEATAAASDAASLQRLREMLDPAAAAQARLTHEMAEAQRVMLAAGHSTDEVARAQALLTQHATGVVASTGQVKAGMQQLQYNLNDMATMWSMQAPLMQIFTSQMGQMIQAVQLMAGTSKGLLGFLGGPWGMGIATAAVVLVPLVSKLFESSDASKDAEKAFDSFVRHQADIANFIDKATVKLTEQNAELRRNAILTRQANIDKNAAAITEQSRVAFGAARGVMGDDTPIYTAGGMTRPAVDPALQSIINGAGSDVAKLDAGLQALAKRRPDLKSVVLEVSNAAAQAVLLQRENAKLSGEVDQLTGKTKGQAVVTADLIRKQIELATATTPLEKARAQYNLVSERGAAAEKMGSAALEQYRRDLTAAAEAVNAAEAAQSAARTGRVEHNKELREAEKQQRALVSAYASTVKALDPLAEATRAYGVELENIQKLEKAGRVSHFDANDLRDAAQAKLEAERVKQIVDGYSVAFQEAIAKPLTVEIDTKGLIQNLDGIIPDVDKLNEALSESEGAVVRYAEAFGSAFGDIGNSIAAVTAALIDHGAEQRKISKIREEDLKSAGKNEAAQAAAQIHYARASAQNQIGAYADITSAAKGMFSERSKAYKILQATETAYRAIQLAMSIQTMVQNAAETASAVINAGVRATAEGTAGIASQSKLPYPYNLAAMAATAAALVAAGVAVFGGFGGGKNDLPKANDGTGTVLGDASAQSESIKNAIDQLKQIDDVTLTVSRDMLSSLRSIESNIGNLASLLVRTGNIDASAGIDTGFKTSGLGSMLSGAGDVFQKIPVVGAIAGAIGSAVKSLFGTKTTIIGSGLYGDDQSVSDILSGGFDASYYSDVKKKKKTFGITTSTKYSTSYADADGDIENQFGLLIREFYTAIGAASGPLGLALGDVEQRLNDFTVNIGKIDLKGLTGAEIQEKLEAVFGAAADEMANAAIPGLEKFQQVGEGAFETLIRVASTVEAMDASFQKLGRTTGSMGVDVDMAIAGMFDSVSDFVGAAGDYFQTYYSEAEQAAANTAQIAKVFDSLNLGMPDTLAGFRSLVEAQDLTTAAGQQTYATLLQLAPAFAELKESMDGAKSAADIISERQNLERQILQLQGDTEAIRAAELAKLDVTNRALQEQIYAIQDAQEAAKAAEQLRQAWTSVGDSIMDEVNRIRGLTNASGGGSFASLLGQFNAANSAARSGDMDAAKDLPQLSKSLLAAAALAATSRQELDRVQAQTAASLEATFAAISGLAEDGTPSITSSSPAATLESLAASSSDTSASATNDDLVSELKALREDVAQLRADTNSGNAAIVSNTGKTFKILDNVTAPSGGNAVAIVQG